MSPVAIIANDHIKLRHARIHTHKLTHTEKE